MPNVGCPKESCAAVGQAGKAPKGVAADVERTLRSR